MFSTNIVIVISLFATPKKKSKKMKKLKTQNKLYNKCNSIRLTNSNYIHFDEYFNNLPKYNENIE
jgi:hypothetical protein